MIKKPTWVVLICALVFGGLAYSLERLHGKSAQSAEIPNLAFSIRASDIDGLTFAHPAKPNRPAIRVVKRNGTWQIVEPVDTLADQAWLSGIADGIADASITQTETISSDRLKVYGLNPPQFSLQFQAGNGTVHTLLFGNLDFLGTSVYCMVDHSKIVWLLPSSILVSSDKSVFELRDRTVLNIDSDGVTSFRLSNPSGEITASKEGADWRFSKPRSGKVDQRAVTSLLSSVAEAKMAAVASEEATDLKQYGLRNPAVTFTAFTNDGKSFTLIAGKDSAGDYFARDVSRPTIFRIGAELYRSLSAKYEDFRTVAASGTN
jgi:hypothetical protein